MPSKEFPGGLRVWFSIHFAVDFLFAIPMMFFPVWSLELFGFQDINTLTTRLVAAALFGIGGISLLVRNETVEVFKTMLVLKLVWSFTAVLGIVLTIIEGGPVSLYLFLTVFFAFFWLWLYYRWRIGYVDPDQVTNS